MKKQDQYTTGELSVLFGVSLRTAAKMIDAGEIKGYRVRPGSRARRVLHASLVDFCRSNPDYQFVMDKFEGVQ